MADAVVRLVEPLRIDSIQLPHPLGEICLWRLHEQVIMVTHQAIGVYHPVETVTDIAQHTKGNTTITVPETDTVSFVTTRGDVVESTTELEPKRSCHPERLVKQRQKRKT